MTFYYDNQTREQAESLMEKQHYPVFDESLSCDDDYDHDYDEEESKKEKNEILLQPLLGDSRLQES